MKMILIAGLMAMWTIAFVNGVRTSVETSSEAEDAEDAIPSETKEDGKVAKRGIPGYGHDLGHGHGHGHDHKHQQNVGWGWGQDQGYNGGNGGGWGGNNFVSDYGFKIGPQKHGDGWGWGWAGQSFANFNPGWTPQGHGHGHAHGHNEVKHHH